MSQFTIKVFLYGRNPGDDLNERLDTAMKAHGFEWTVPGEYKVISGAPFTFIQDQAKKAANAVTTNNSVFVSYMIQDL